MHGGRIRQQAYSKAVFYIKFSSFINQPFGLAHKVQCWRVFNPNEEVFREPDHDSLRTGTKCITLVSVINNLWIILTGFISDAISCAALRVILQTDLGVHVFLLMFVFCALPQVTSRRCAGTRCRGCSSPAARTTRSSCGTSEGAKAPPSNCRDTSENPRTSALECVF